MAERAVEAADKISRGNSDRPFEYYIIPAKDMAKNVGEAHELWLQTPGKKGRAHKDNSMRIFHLPPHKPSFAGWDISSYHNQWNLIGDKLI